MPVLGLLEISWCSLDAPFDILGEAADELVLLFQKGGERKLDVPRDTLDFRDALGADFNQEGCERAIVEPSARLRRLRDCGQVLRHRRDGQIPERVLIAESRTPGVGRFRRRTSARE